MANKLHCDVCDVVIGNNRGGHVEATPLHGMSDGTYPMDLTFEQGGMVTWPKRRTS